MYTDKGAHTAQTMMIEYINGKEDINSLKRIFKFLELESLFAQNSKNSANLMINAVGFPYDKKHHSNIPKHKQDGLAHDIMSLLIARAKVVDKQSECGGALKFLLLTPSNAGYTPLHSLLQAGNAINLSLYLDAIKYGIQNGSISEEDYVKVLLQLTTHLNNTLHEALRGGNIENLRRYFQEVEHYVKNKSDYADLLLHPNESKYTPLHSVVLSGKPKNLRLYLEKIEACITDGQISANSFASLLFEVNNEHSTPLHLVFRSTNAETLALYLNKIEDFIARGFVSEEDYVRLLLCRNQFGLTAFDIALKSGNADNIYTLFEKITLRVKQGLISWDTYKSLLFGGAADNSTPLHQAASGGNLEICKWLVEDILPWECNSKEYFFALTTSTKDGNMPKTIMEGTEINHYLETTRQEYLYREETPTERWDYLDLVERYRLEDPQFAPLLGYSLKSMANWVARGISGMRAASLLSANSIFASQQQEESILTEPISPAPSVDSVDSVDSAYSGFGSPFL